jgi:hypothetical protein
MKPPHLHACIELFIRGVRDRQTDFYEHNPHYNTHSAPDQEQFKTHLQNIISAEVNTERTRHLEHFFMCIVNGDTVEDEHVGTPLLQQFFLLMDEQRGNEVDETVEDFLTRIFDDLPLQMGLPGEEGEDCTCERCETVFSRSAIAEPLEEATMFSLIFNTRGL